MQLAYTYKQNSKSTTQPTMVTETGKREQACSSRVLLKRSKNFSPSAVRHCPSLSALALGPIL